MAVDSDRTADRMSGADEVVLTTEVALTGLQVIAAMSIGVLAGLGLFTFSYAEGLSYLSSDPKACVNCHIMREQYDNWLRYSHHAAAKCVDCHLPPSFIPKFIAKGENGYHHSKGFTFQDFHEPIMIKQKNSQILQDNCLRCHGDMTEMLTRGSTTGDNAVRCVHCHASVGHGPLQ